MTTIKMQETIDLESIRSFNKKDFLVDKTITLDMSDTNYFHVALIGFILELRQSVDVKVIQPNNNFMRGILWINN